MVSGKRQKKYQRKSRCYFIVLYFVR
jgi:hypothetical protein